MIKPRLRVPRASSVKNNNTAHLPLAPPSLHNNTMLNKSSTPGGISRVENSTLLRATQRRTGTSERHRALSIWGIRTEQGTGKKWEGYQKVESVSSRTNQHFKKERTRGEKEWTQALLQVGEED